MRHHPRGAGRFLVVRLSALGDVLHAVPAVEALRRARPHARIDWIVEDRFAPLLDDHPALDRVHIVPRARWRAAARRPWRWPRIGVEVVRLVLTLWRARYDAVLDLQGNGKSGLSSLLSGAPVRYGFATGGTREGNGFFTNRHVSMAASSPHHVDRALHVVEAAVGRPAISLPRAPLPRSKAARAWVDAALSGSGMPDRGYGVVHPGTSGFGSFKRWPAERFGRLAQRIAARGVRTIVTVGPGEAALGAEVARASGGVAIVLAPPDLGALTELLSRAAVLVAADTGPLHIAAAERVPVVALFGPKDAATYGPRAEPGLADLTAIVTRDDVPCRPCTLRRCPDPVCMTSIEVEEVYERVRRVLATAR